ncbi:hypothetical protein BHM03_00062474, partial [Ensete ventricosum]
IGVAGQCMHYVVGWLGLFLYGFLFEFEAFFRWFVILILHWFNHEEPALLTAMFAAPRFREEVPLLASSGGGFILTGRRLDRMLGLTFADTLGEVTVYSESVDTEVWREGVACHVTLMARGGGLATAPSDRLYLRC